MIADGTFQQGLGAGHCQRRSNGDHAMRRVARLQDLGYAVALETAAA